MNNELFKNVAASTIFYEIEQGTNGSFNVDAIVGAINLYLSLCEGNKDSFARVIEAIEGNNELQAVYFDYDDAETFLEKYGNKE